MIILHTGKLLKIKLLFYKNDYTKRSADIKKEIKSIFFWSVGGGDDRIRRAESGILWKAEAVVKKPVV